MSWISRKEYTEQRNGYIAKGDALLKNAFKESRGLTPEENKEFDAYHDMAQKLEGQIQRLDAEKEVGSSEVVERNLFASAPETRDGKPALSERSKAFSKYVRGLGLNEMEKRALTVGGSTTGAEMVPENAFDRFTKRLRETSVIFQLNPRVDVVDNSRPTPYPLYSDTAEGEIITAGGTATASADPATGSITLGGKIFSSKRMGLAKDYILNTLDAEGVIMEMGGERISIHFDKKCTLGVTGSGEPGGYMVGITTGKTAAAAAAITYNEVLDLIHSLPRPYRPGALLTFTDATLLAVRKLVDGDGNSIWHHGVGQAATGFPPTIAGVPYVVNPYMAEIGASNKPICYGNFNRGYAVRQVGQAELFVDPYTNGGKYVIDYILYHLLDGGVVDTSAFRSLVNAAS